MLCYLIIIFDVQHAGNPVHIGFKSNPRVYSSQMVPDAVSQRHTRSVDLGNDWDCIDQVATFWQSNLACTTALSLFCYPIWNCHPFLCSQFVHLSHSLRNGNGSKIFGTQKIGWFQISGRFRSNLEWPAMIAMWESWYVVMTHGSSGPCSESWGSAEGHSTADFGQSSGLNILPKEPKEQCRPWLESSILKTLRFKMLDVFGDSCSLKTREFLSHLFIDLPEVRFSSRVKELYL